MYGPTAPPPSGGQFGSPIPRFMPAIDGLRALSIFGVLMLHFGWMPVGRQGLLEKLHLCSVFQYGWVGVDIFFAISGFLITGILLDSKDSPHYFLNFYARRALRIWPIYYAVVLFVFVIYPLVSPDGTFVHKGGWLPYLVYTQNFTNFSAIPLLAVSWTLAIEEQFYITWPLIVFAYDRKTLQRVVILLLVASPLIRLALDPFVGYEWLYLPFGRLDGILAGSLLALWFRSESFSVSRLRMLAPGLLLVGALGCVLLLPNPWGWYQKAFAFSFLAMASSGLVCFAAVDSILPGPIRSFLTCPPARYIGKISYGIYLLHPIVYIIYNYAIRVLRLPMYHNTVAGYTISLFAELALAVLVASLSWYLFEQPILRMKKKFERGSVSNDGHSAAENFARTPERLGAHSLPVRIP